MEWGPAMLPSKCNQCDRCDGRGEGACKVYGKCGGEACGHCDGTGRRECTVCKGSGRRECEKCDGRGCPSWRYESAAFRAAFEQSGMSLSMLSDRCGWDSSYSSRVLGIRPHKSMPTKGSGKTYQSLVGNKTLMYDSAVKLAKALELDLVEWCI